MLRSAQPAIAALAGLVLLGQALALHEVLGIAVVAATNALAVLGTRPRARGWTRPEAGGRACDSRSATRSQRRTALVGPRT